MDINIDEAIKKQEPRLNFLWMYINIDEAIKKQEPSYDVNWASTKILTVCLQIGLDGLAGSKLEVEKY